MADDGSTAGGELHDGLSCADVAERALVERYVAGALPEGDAEEFEAHYVTCPRCQGELRLAAAVRDASAGATASGRRGRPLLWAGVGVGLAAAVALGLLIPSRGELSGRRLSELGGVLVAPVYLGIQVRGPGGSADSLFEVAMDAYIGGDYASALAGLDAALQAGVDLPPALFFRGASLLMLDRPSEAALSFERVVALGDTPYLGEAHYYLAKALLRLGRAADAREHLRLVAAHRPELADAAAALADSVAEATKR